MSLLLSLLLFIGIASASEAPAIDVSDAPSDAELHDLESRALYRVGLELMELGQYPEARIVMRRILLEYPDTEAAENAVDMLASMEGLTGGRGVDSGALARAEFAINQAITSAAFFGFLLPASTWQPSAPLVPVSMGVAGMGAGITGGLLAAKRFDLSTGQVMSVFTGQWLGAGNGLVASAINPPRDYRGLYRYATGGMLLGTAAGSAVAWKLDPSAGQVAMVNAGAAYGAYLTGWSFAYFFDDDGEDRTWATSRRVALRMGIGTDAGAALGLAAAYLIPVSRGRMNVITLAGLTGTAAAGAVAFLVNFYSYGLEIESVGAIILAGGAAGLGTGAVLTRKMERDAGYASASGVLIERVDDRWAFGVPMAMVTPAPEGGMQVSVPLASGRF
ncbi:MAG: hypothetical protein GY913_18450 [Proteobacteria bacterium]|nr:hypothetical protein [Pseudomonadota bacterium]MCP4918891.1 hypothetical protein [Pseudomonadota bacterium]